MSEEWTTYIDAHNFTALFCMNTIKAVHTCTHMTSHIQYTMYKIIVCIECAAILRADIKHLMREYKVSEGVSCYSR